MKVKVIILLHEGSNCTTKLWRFDSDSLQSYTLELIKAEVLSLFPHLQEKELSVKLWHDDDLVGKVHLL
jgi:hypothetical protein